MIYLAVPYSHADLAVRAGRCEAADKMTAILMEAGNVVFSPISMTHHVEQHMSEIHSSEWWDDICKPFMEHCTQCVVLSIAGWETSKGVTREVAWFKARGVPVFYVSPGE